MTRQPAPIRIREVIHAYVKGFADRDLDALCALYADDATIEDPVGTPKRRGAAEIRAFYAMALAAAPTLRITAEPVIVGAFSATPLAAEVTMDGRVLVIELISVMGFAPDGRITSMTACFDPAMLGE